MSRVDGRENERKERAVPSRGLWSLVLSGVLCVTMAFGVTVAANAASIMHRGPIIGVNDSSVIFKVQTKAGKPSKVKHIFVTGLPLACSDGSSAVFPRTDLPNTRVRGNKFKANRGIEAGPVSIEFTLTGTLKSRGKRAEGTVRLRGTVDNGAGGTGTCDSRKRRFETR